MLKILEEYSIMQNDFEKNGLLLLTSIFVFFGCAFLISQVFPFSGYFKKGVALGFIGSLVIVALSIYIYIYVTTYKDYSEDDCSDKTN